MAALFVAKLTPADVTPLAPVSASCTVAAQLAHVMPSIGSTIRLLLMSSAVELVRRRRGAALAGRLYDEQTLEHVHAAAERVFARLGGHRLAARVEEVPQHPDDGDGAERRDGDLGGRHPALATAPASSRRRRSAWHRTSARRIPAR